MRNDAHSAALAHSTAFEGNCFATEAAAAGPQTVHETRDTGDHVHSLEQYMLTSPMKVLATVDGWPITLATQSEAVDAIADAALRAEAFSVFALDLEHLVALRSNPHFRRAYEAASFVTASSEAVARMASRQHARVERTAGPDLVVPLALEAAAKKFPIYLLGASAASLGKAGRALDERCGGKLDLAGTWSPSRDFDPGGPEADEAIRRIAQSGARLCFVALDTPKQELFAAYAATCDLNVGFVCVGSGLDFLAGEQRRAPQFMRRYGLEWLWRVLTRPNRLALHGLKCACVLADIGLLGSLRQSLFGAKSAG